ncbi:MAG: ADP-glyceromanno-heptose 6-epimerase [Candidatus Eremiobacteraeota bacterium]|nr:ADP-glyceromanno-heptose 6-epimerase [Candidatus Eremiobacteraeota bacterium]
MEFEVPGRLLLTGGAGFIGSALLWELNRRGFDNAVVVDVLDRTEKWKNLVPLRFHDYLEAAALLERVERQPSWLDEFNLIVHLGACSSTTETDAAYLMRNNYGFTKMLAEAAVSRGIRFVYASSAATYGALEDELSESRPLASLRPLNMYAYSKHLFDLYAERTGLMQRITGLKYFNVFGPNEQHKGEMRSVVAKAYEQIQRDGVVRLFRSYRDDISDGEQRRDFLYVKDAVRMTLFLATTPTAVGLFNIGSGTAHTWRHLAEALFCAVRREPRIEYIDMPMELRNKYQYHTEARLDRLREAGYREASRTLEDGVGDYVVRYLSRNVRLDPNEA